MSIDRLLQEKLTNYTLNIDKFPSHSEFWIRKANGIKKKIENRKRIIENNTN